MKLSVVVPCYNEALSLREFYDGVSLALKENKISYEFIMVDDGSTDDTYNKLLELNELDKNVKIISFSRNFGKEQAMYAGLKCASGSYVAIMDADLQHTPSMLLEMYKKLVDNNDYDVVCAYNANRMDESGLKRTLTSIFYKVNNKISDVKLLPGASDFRVFRKQVREAILLCKDKTRFLKGIFSWVGFNTIYVPYTPQKRVYGISKWSLFKLFKYSLGGIISFSTTPIKLVFVVGVLVFLISLFNFLLFGNLAFRTVILLIGILMFCIGVIALYVSRIYSNLLDRPTYIIKNKIGFKDVTK